MITLIEYLFLYFKSIFEKIINFFIYFNIFKKILLKTFVIILLNT
jgi:hypothetical protein